MNLQEKFDAALTKQYDLNGKGLTLNSDGFPVAHLSGAKLVAGYELVRRMDLAHRQIETLKIAIRAHRDMLADEMSKE